jgi:hypothetical protein
MEIINLLAAAKVAGDDACGVNDIDRPGHARATDNTPSPHRRQWDASGRAAP